MTREQELAAAEQLRDSHDAEPMHRFGGKPYREGENWRCPDCNGICVMAARHYPINHREAICRTCGRSALLNDQGNLARIPIPSFRRTA